jgi:hypothetical protein
VLAGVQLKLSRRLVYDIETSNIPYSLLKGEALRYPAYHRPEQRCGKDIDLAVPRPYLPAATAASLDNGFVPAEWSWEERRFRPARPELRRQVESRHHELGFLVRRQVVTDLTDAEAAAIRRDLANQVIWHTTDTDELACYISLDIHHGGDPGLLNGGCKSRRSREIGH